MLGALVVVVGVVDVVGVVAADEDEDAAEPEWPGAASDVVAGGVVDVEPVDTAAE